MDTDFQEIVISNFKQTYQSHNIQTLNPIVINLYPVGDKFLNLI